MSDERDVDGAADTGWRVHEREPGDEGRDRAAARVDAQDLAALAGGHVQRSVGPDCAA
jgi:hypothetical protein